MHVPGVYSTVVLLLSGLACFSLATHIHSRWLAARGVSFAAVHCSVLAVICAAGTTVVSPAALLPRSLERAAFSLAAGAAAGWLSVRADRAVVRFLSRRELLRGRRVTEHAAGASRRRFAHDVSTTLRPVTMAVRGSGVSRRTVGLIRSEAVRPYSGGGPVLLAAFLVSGALEEVVFRGLLLQLVLRLHHVAAVAAAVAGLAAMFALGHIFFGWAHVLAKTPLSILTTIVTLALGSVLAAIAAHVVFNLAAALEARDHAVPACREAAPPLQAWLGDRAGGG
jgi:membrane protease YdiL (CAAX protease family)